MQRDVGNSGAAQQNARVLVGEGAGLRECARGEIGAHVEGAEQTNVLIRARDPGARHAVRRQSVDAPLAERDRAGRCYEMLQIRHP